MPSIELAHGRLSFEQTGSGPPLLLLHGLLATSFTWRHNLEALGRHFTCYAVNAPGLCGSAPLPGFRAPLSRLAEVMLTFMNALGLPEMRVMGSSWGGSVALLVALRAPQRVTRLALVAPLHPWATLHARQRLLLTWPFSYIAGALLRHRSNAFFRGAVGAMLYDPAQLTDAAVLGYAVPLRSAPARLVPGYVAGWRREMAQVRAAAAGLRPPTLLLWGDRDPVVSLASGRRCAQHLPPARLAVVPATGHLPHEEQPEVFLELALPFLKT